MIIIIHINAVSRKIVYMLLHVSTFAGNVNIVSNRNQEDTKNRDSTSDISTFTAQAAVIRACG